MVSKFNYIIAMDFEATCFVNDPPIGRRKSEIIEFPAVLMHLETGVIEAEFHRYVRPNERPILSDFCKNLTGITQEKVNEASVLKDVLNDFDKWLSSICVSKKLKIPNGQGLYFSSSDKINNCAFVTWGNDFDYFLGKECTRKSISTKPSYFNNWINLKTIFMISYPHKSRPSFEDALNYLGINFIGRQHSGLDDARNTAKLCYELKKRGKNLRITNTY